MHDSKKDPRQVKQKKKEKTKPFLRKVLIGKG